MVVDETTSWRAVTSAHLVLSRPQRVVPAALQPQPGPLPQALLPPALLLTDLYCLQTQRGQAVQLAPTLAMAPLQSCSSASPEGPWTPPAGRQAGGRVMSHSLTWCQPCCCGAHHNLRAYLSQPARPAASRWRHRHALCRHQAGTCWQHPDLLTADCTCLRRYSLLSPKVSGAQHTRHC